MRAISALVDQLNRQRGYLFPWAPVFFATGIAIYFTLKFEPGREHWTGLTILMGVTGLLQFRLGPTRALPARHFC